MGPQAGDTDVAGLRRGDPEAFDEILARYQHRLYRYLVRLVRDRALAEDLFQQTWLRVTQKIGQYDPRRNFEAWLFSVARNLAIDHLRRYRPESLDAPPPGAPGDAPRVARLAAGGRSALDHVLERERSERLEAALGLLPWIYREALTLRFEEEMKIEEMAGVLDVPLSTAKTRLRRGLEQLRRILEAQGTPGEWS
ncbi:MAG: sigma-70 family RNA polymerase sigma factor [Acidobacteriia bacterium]|nr:sigma-70 family RNA polymerase sigma factor [Terriglobia bacterium]